ncbi:hypothetical protein D3C71_1257490 [compost metagenome]
MRQRTRRFQQFRFPLHTRHQARGVRLVRAERPAGEQQVKRPVLTYDGGQVRVVDRRQNPHIDLRVAERGGVRRNDHVAGNGHRHAAAPHRARHHRDRRLRQIELGVVELDVKPGQERVNLHGRTRQELLHIKPRAEPAGQFAGQQYGTHPGVGVGAVKRGDQRVQHVHVQRIDRGVAQMNLRDPVADLVAQIGHEGSPGSASRVAACTLPAASIVSMSSDV